MENIKTNLTSNRIGGLNPTPEAKKPQGEISSKGPSFDEVLKTNLTAKPQIGGAGLSPQASGIKFSNHAIERIKSRGIEMGPEQLERLGKAVEKAESKGAKETLVLLGNDSALIVNIKNKTVVTALDQSMMKENVFTNIDSTVIL
jgi:flagellar operon protein